jgi:hypothetical protein
MFMSTDKPVGATLITKYEAQQIGRANASGRTPVSRLLFVSGEGEGEGEEDHTVPCAVTNAAFKRRQRNKGVTEIVEVPGRGHALTINSWRDVTGTALVFVPRFTRSNDPPSVGREVRKDSADAQFGGS